MDIHAEYFLKCSEAAKWLNTPQPITGVPKEFLDGAHAVTNSISAATVSPSTPTPHCNRNTPSSETPSSHSTKKPRAPSNLVPRRTSPHTCPALSQKPVTSHPPPPLHHRNVSTLKEPFPSLSDLPTANSTVRKSLLYVPVHLHDHFIFGVAIGCPVPPPAGVSAAVWRPLVNRFVLDPGRKCCLMFSYFAEGSIVVSVDCFDEVGDHFSEVTFFEPTPVVGVFPRGIRGRMQISEKRDCPSCTTAAVSCACPVQQRVEAIVKARQNRVLVPEHGPAHAGATYKDDNVTIQTYPYWAQVLDEYKWSRVGSYSIQTRYTPAVGRPPCSPPASVPHCREPTNVSYRSKYTAEPRVTVEKMLRVALFDQGVSALKPPATDVRWESSSTVAVSAQNEIRVDTDSPKAVCVTDWHKLPGFQEDYLLVAPSNIVSGAHARAELARAEAERLAAQARSGVPVLPSWASGRVGVFEHILNESGPELEMSRGPIEKNRVGIVPQVDFHAQILRHFPQASVGTVMRMRGSLDSAGREIGLGAERRWSTLDENVRRASLESSTVVRRRMAMGTDWAGTNAPLSSSRAEGSRRVGFQSTGAASGSFSPRRAGLELQRRGDQNSSEVTPRSSGDSTRYLDGPPSFVDCNRAGIDSSRKRRLRTAAISRISLLPL